VGIGPEPYQHHRMSRTRETADPYTFWDTTARDLIMVSGYGASGGRVRTAEEFRALVEAGGLTLAGIIPTSPVSVIEALYADTRPG
jgi:hypothetical protein